MKLTNNDISVKYRGGKWFIFKSDILGAFAYWVVKQSPYCSPDITPALTAWDNYLSQTFKSSEAMVELTYGNLKEIINDDIFESIPEILELNNRKNGKDGMAFCSRSCRPDPDDDFIDLGALARNVFFMVLRENITQS